MTATGTTIISFSNVHKYYPLGKTKVHATKNVSFDLMKGDFVSFAGPSGSGKTTILNMISCIDTPDEGTVTINGHITNELNDTQITTLRHKTIGFIFQSFNLIPVLDVYENIEFPLLLDKATKAEKANRKEWIDYLIDVVGLTDWKKHRPNELSGGQRQRLAVARALVTKTPIVLADEPTANLDSKSSENIIMLMKKMNKEFGTTFVFSTHDQTIVNIADHIIRIRDGEIVENSRKKQE
jgi:putative ABC transport system ATP-binding protein